MLLLPSLSMLGMMRHSLPSLPALALIIAFSNLPALAETAPSNRVQFTQLTRLIAAASTSQAGEASPFVDGETITIEGSTSMASINAVLGQRFETLFPEVQVNADYTSTDAALIDLQQDRIDLAAIARSLTPEERAQNLVAVPVRRWKIAIVVGEDNPFSASLSVGQIVKIFRGEITDWSEVGGRSRPIRVVEQAPTSYARQALKTYEAFQADASQLAENAVQLSEDTPEKTIEQMVKELGDNGISYAIAPQVMYRKGLSIVPLHGTLPNDPQYPFSKPLAYVYKGPTPSPVVQAYLDFATDPDNRGIIEVAERGGALSSSDGAPLAQVDAASDDSTASAGKQSGATESNKSSSATDKLIGSGKSDTDEAIAPTRQASMWRWLIFLPIVGIVIWSLFREP